MALGKKFIRIEITDEAQSGPVDVDVFVAVTTDQSDVLAATGSNEIRRVPVACSLPRAQAVALLQACTIKNPASIPAAVLALISPPLQQ